MTQKTSDKKPKNSQTQIFNRHLLKIRRERIADNFADHNFLVKEVSRRLIDNLQDIKRDYKTILNLNCDHKSVTEHLPAAFVINQDLSSNMLDAKAGTNIQADEEFLPIRTQSLDLILSCLTLHWVNDLPGTLIQMIQSLKPDGLFLGAFFGGETLTELRQVMMKADMDHLGGISPHISPFIDVRDAGALMQRAGFALPVASVERITVNYLNAYDLMKELKGMGENNALIKRYKALSSRKMMMKVVEYYHREYAKDDGRIPATFEIIYMQGWAPDQSQQKPLMPGSAKMSLKDALGKTPPKHQ